MAMTARAWKTFYAEERARLGARGLAAMLDEAESLGPLAAPLIFPHTRLETSGALVAAAALAIVRSGADAALAIGVLHNPARGDASLRGVHTEDGLAAEEFSLDNLRAFVELAAARAGRAAPQVFARFPFLAGAAPETLPGFDELAALATRMPVVATADMIHHGAGYDTPPAARRARDATETEAFARSTLDELLALLAAGDFATHEARAAAVRSDFKDAGPVFATLTKGRVPRQIHALRLVDYADVFSAEQPTWVAAAVVWNKPLRGGELRARAG